MKKIKNWLVNKQIELVTFMADTKGNETTDKLGWVLIVVAIIVALLALAPGAFTDIFNSIITKVKAQFGV